MRNINDSSRLASAGREVGRIWGVLGRWIGRLGKTIPGLTDAPQIDRTGHPVIGKPIVLGRRACRDEDESPMDEVFAMEQRLDALVIRVLDERALTQEHDA